MNYFKKLLFAAVLVSFASCGDDDNDTQAPEAFSIVDVDIEINDNTDPVNFIESITWEKSVDPDGTEVTYDLTVNQVLLASDIAENEDDDAVTYEEDIDLSTSYTTPITINITAVDDNGESAEAEEVIEFILDAETTLGTLEAGEFRTYYSTVENDDVDINFIFTIDSELDYVIETIQGNYDTVLELEDEEGNFINLNDDGGVNFLSKLEGTLSVGTYNLEVRGFSADVGQGELSILLSNPQ